VIIVVSPNTNRIPQKDKVKQGVSWGVEGAVLATSGAIGSESSPIPQGASSFVQGAGSKSLPGVPQGSGGGTDSYLESYDNVSSWLATTCDKNGVGWFITGECQNGHRFAKELVCGKEFCGVCGEDGSVAHMRRFARWLPKAQQLGVMGYFVFTIPQELRAKYRTKKALSRLGHQVQELLKSWGYYRGLRRWHWFGDITRAGLRGSPVFHPHLNCLVGGQGGGYLSPRVLKAIKLEYASLVYGVPAKDIDLQQQPVDVNYRYRLSPGKMVHSLKYVTRATFRDYDWDLEMAMKLRGFRNMVVWGRGQWDGEAAWSLDELGGEARAEVEDLDIEAIEALVEKRCPVCGEPIEWGEALPIGLLDMVDKRSLGAGYWRLTDNKSSPPVADDVKQRLYWMGLVHRAEVQVAARRAEAEAIASIEAYQGWWDSLLKQGELCRG